MATRQVTFLINANVKNFTKGMDSASKRFKKFGRNMERMGRNLTRSITAPVLAAGAGAVKMASDFEGSMTKIETLVGLSRDQVQGMRKDVLALARGTGKAPQELSEALFTVTSAGLRGANAMQVLERSSKASAIGLGNTRDIAKATTAVMQAYGEDVMSASLAPDTLTAIVREGNLEASELAPVLGRVVGIASQLGISFQEVGASIATFTRLGVSSEEAVTGLRGVMNALIKPTTQGNKALQTIGLTFEDLRAKVQDDGLMATLRMLVEQFDGNDEALSQLIPNVRALSAVLGTAGAQGEAYEKILGNIQNSTGIVDDGFERVSETVQFKFNKALASLKASAIELGTVLLPVATKIIDRVQKMADWFSKLSNEAQILGLKIAAIAAFIGPTLLVLGKLAKLIAFMVSPTFLAAAAITGLFTAIVVGGQWLVDNSSKLYQGLYNLNRTMLLSYQKMAKGIIVAIKEVIEFMVNRAPHAMLAKVFGIDVGEWATDVIGINKVVDSLTDTIEEGEKELSEGIGKYNQMSFGSLTDSAKNALELTKNSIIKGLKGILNSSQIQGLIDEMNSMFAVSAGGANGGGNPMSKEFERMERKSLGLETARERVERLADGFTKLIKPMEKATSRWDTFKMKVEDIGGSFKAFLADEMSSAVLSFGEALGKSLSGAENTWQTTFEKITMVVLDFAKSLAQLAAAIGGVMMFIPGMQGMGAGLLAAAMVLQAASTAVSESIKKRASNRQKRAGMANGGIVPSGFPNDSYPAMLSSGETVIPSPKPLPSFGMSGKIEVPVYLNDREIARAMSDYSKDLGR